MSFVRPFLLVLACVTPTLAQQLSHPLTASREDVSPSPRDVSATADTINILAVMVQFQTDGDIRTTGDGRFVLTGPNGATIDAPPRNKAYFENHLTFLENYYSKASKGKIVVRWTMVDSVYTLPAVMGTYSPARNTSNEPIARLARDTWRTVDSSGKVSDFSRYQCFVVFHAGVGRDVDLVGSLGYDPAPFDIPSLYIGPKAFTELLGGGVPVKGGAFTIKNTIVMPETESRRLPGVVGEYLLELGINGLLCASVGNYLGLPDLFNTQSGASAIGRFGLMDGQAIFSFSGIFPPEPSAWEKYWLGWLAPLTVPVGTSTLNLPAVGLADTIYRIPVSDGEYFLLENRSRDPQRNGQTVTSVYNGVVTRQTFARDTTGFNAFDISKISGTVTDVEDLDWSLPGGVSSDGTLYDGGILIWHIDERVIQQNISTNEVNADPSRRGVDLEEADGSQDIGKDYGQFSAGSGSEEGTALDFWFKGSTSPVNKNEFSATTFPNSNSNLGALSHITIRDFSVRGPRMTVKVTRGDAVAPLRGYPRATGERLYFPSLTVADVGLHPGSEIVIGTSGRPIGLNTTAGLANPVPSTGGKLMLLPSDTTSFVPPFRTSGIAGVSTTSLREFSGAPAVADLNGDGIPEIIAVETPGSGGGGPIVRAFSARDLNADSLADEFFSVALAPATTDGLGTPVVSDSLIAVQRYGVKGVVYFLRFNGVVADSMTLTTPSTTSLSRWIGSNAFIICDQNRVLLTTRTPTGGAFRPATIGSFTHKISGPAATGLFGREAGTSTPLLAFTTADGLIYLVDSTMNPVAGFPVSTGDDSLGSPVVADIDGDGVRDVVVLGRTKIYVYNMAGALVDHFPVNVTSAFGRTSPLVGDVDGDGRVDIVGVSADGLAYAFDRGGKTVPGFPLLVGGGLNQSAALVTGNGAIMLFTASFDGTVSSWITGRLSGPPKPALYPWPQYGRDERHSSLDLTPLGVPLAASQFFPKERAYNWPNPVYGGKTFIRYFVSDNAAVSVKIFDLAGDLVTQLSGQGIGGMDNEIAWDVSGVQSGVYFARVEASGPGLGAVAVIKIAVVK